MNDETQLEGSALWKQITRIPRPGRTVDFPRKDPKTGEPAVSAFVTVLTQEELQEASAAAEKFARSRLKDVSLRKGDKTEGYDQIYNNEVSVQILCKAVRDVEEPHHPLFPSPRTAAKTLTQEEFGMLFWEYLKVQAELGPVVASMTAEEMEAFIERLVEGARCHPLALLSSEALTALASFMAYRLYPSLTVTSSPGSQLDDS